MGCSGSKKAETDSDSGSSHEVIENQSEAIQGKIETELATAADDAPRIESRNKLELSFVSQPDENYLNNDTTAVPECGDDYVTVEQTFSTQKRMLIRDYADMERIDQHVLQVRLPNKS